MEVGQIVEHVLENGEDEARSGGERCAPHTSRYSKSCKHRC